MFDPRNSYVDIYPRRHHLSLLFKTYLSIDNFEELLEEAGRDKKKMGALLETIYDIDLKEEKKAKGGYFCVIS